MFEFSDKDIDSTLCQPCDTVSGEEECGFILTVRDVDIFLTESEIQYIQDQVNKIKGGN